MPSFNSHRHRSEDAEEPAGNHPGADDGAHESESRLAPEESLVDLRCSVIVARGHDVLLLHRRRGREDEWVLPRGRPSPGEGMLSCARREVTEETGIRVVPERCAFVAEVVEPGAARRQVELTFTARLAGSASAELVGEEGVEPAWVPVGEVRKLNLKPAVAGFLTDVVTGRAKTAPYLGNLWRPEDEGTSSEPVRDGDPRAQSSEGGR